MDYVTPESDGMPETTEGRKEAFLRYAETIGKHSCDEERQNRTTLRYVKNGGIPWGSTQHDPDEYDKTWDIHGSYFITVFWSTATKCILKDEEGLRSMLKERRENTPDRSDYPQDGSHGQAQAARQNAIKTIEWFLCEYDGEYEPDSD